MKKIIILLLASFSLNDAIGCGTFLPNGRNQNVSTPAKTEMISKNFKDLSKWQGVDEQKEILSLVKKGISDIECCTGNDIVMVIGISQTGKSTFINYLSGSSYHRVDPFDEVMLDQEEQFPEEFMAKLDVCDDMKKGLTWVDSSAPEVASVGTGDGCGVTDLPKGYKISGVPFVLLDTRGFFHIKDPSKNEDAMKIYEIASSILVNLAIKNAKSVRVLVLQSYGELEKGINTLERIDSVLKKVFTSNSLPVLFLYNRFTPHYPEDWQEFISLNLMDDIQQFVKDDILRSVNSVFETYGMGEVKISSVKDFFARVSNYEKQSENDKDLVFIECLRENLDNDRFAYFDPSDSAPRPCDIDYRKYVFSLLGNLSSADKKYINFSEYSKELRKFISSFGLYCLDLDKILSSKEKYFMYSDTFLKKLI